VSQGIDLSAYNTTESANDLADLRTALGIKEWSVFGHSYGTELALVLLRDHPQGIRSFTIDGQFPPSAISIAYLWDGPQQAYTNMFDACTAQSSCATNYPQLRQTLTRLGQQLETNPVKTQVTLDDGSQVPVTLDTGELLGWINLATHFAPSVPASLDALAKGNPQPIAKQWATAKQNHSGDVGAFSWGLFDNIACREVVPFSSPSQDLEAGQRALPGFPESVLSAPPTLAFFFLRDVCPIWNVPQAPSAFRAATTSSVPSLLLNGGFDAQTAPGNGAYVARTLSHATNLVIPGIAHGVYVESPCAQVVLKSFLDNPNAPDTSCVATVKPAPFTIGLQHATPASPNEEPQNEPD
jgi:pimeloyl-ACP methyl ester carboxylesterase